MMSGHRVVIEAGPGSVRRLCCGTGEPAESAATALDCIDDPVALVDGQPVGVTRLWGSVLRSLACPDRQSAPETVVVIHPSWWSASRVELVTGAARTLADDVVTRPRSWLLSATAHDTRTRVVVEIAARLVAITGSGTAAEPRSGPPQQVTDAVVRRVAAMTRGTDAAVLIDGPGSVGGAPALAAMIDERLRAVLDDARVAVVDDARLARLGAAVPPAEAPLLPAEAPPRGPEPPTARRRLRIPALLAAVVVLGVAVFGVSVRVPRQYTDVPVAHAIPTTFLVEGRVALEVPAQWPVRQVTAGPGSARVEVVSPSDPQVVLHVTQSPVPDGTLAGTAESLRHAVQQANSAEPTGIFVDFNPSGTSAGRSAVTYREVREHHHVDWTVLVEGAVRISIGCQSPPDDPGAVREVCEQAVRSARVIG